ncbi:ribosomal protein L7/L12 [Streptosporangium sp. NPDC000396]|uniref:ribosomal protein L7/L12 n=1 Tax=Streptosporangium sp. NPDC000396 TaxID=3366185 RepID=UPI003674A31E
MEPVTGSRTKRPEIATSEIYDRFMPSLGSTELFILLVVLALLIIGLVLLVRRRPRTPAPRLSPLELHQQVAALAAAQEMIPAIKLVREQTGLGLAEAKRYVDDLAAGRAFAPVSPGNGADLATRVRQLKTAGRTEQAMLLVRDETGMSEPDAQRFVESIQTATQG